MKSKHSIDSKGNSSLHGYRGKALERSLNKLCKEIQKQGFHAHKNEPKRTYDGRFISGEPFDYEIFTPNYKWCFDAKECKGDSWNLSNAKLSQVNALKQCKNAGLDAFFLVYFYQTKKLIRFDVDTVINSDKSSLKPEDGTEVDVNVLFEH